MATRAALIALLAVAGSWSAPAAAEECVDCWVDRCAELSTSKPKCEAGAPPRACPPGKTATDGSSGHCCWPGQAWKDNRCAGEPATCIAPFVLNVPKATCDLGPCGEGMARASDKIHCCWAGQKWAAAQDRCTGLPSHCPAGYVLEAVALACEPTAEKAAALNASKLDSLIEAGAKDSLVEAGTKADATATDASSSHGQGKAELGALLARASAASSAPTKEKATTPPRDPSLPDQLDRPAIAAGMNSARDKAIACYDEFLVRGVANVHALLLRSGKVSTAEVRGKLAGTPEGDCVQKAVLGATFGRFNGPDMSVDFPFMLQ